MLARLPPEEQPQSGLWLLDVSREGPNGTVPWRAVPLEVAGAEDAAGGAAAVHLAGNDTAAMVVPAAAAGGGAGTELVLVASGAWKA